MDQAVKDFAEWVTGGSGQPPPVSDHVFVRAARGKTEAAFETLGAGPGRRLAWATSARDVVALGRLAPIALLKMLGKNQKALDQAQRNGERWKLIVFATAEAQLGDWPGLLNAMQRSYPVDTVQRIARHLEALRDNSLETLLGGEYERFESARGDAKHPDHMSLERYQAAEDSARNARLFLWHGVGLNKNYAGTGQTKDDDQRPGLAEYFVPNLPLPKLSAVLVDLVDLGV